MELSFKRYDKDTMLHYVGNVLIVLSIANIVPTVFALLFEESLAFKLLMVFETIIIYVIGYMLSRQYQPGSVGLVEAMTIMVFAFLLPPFMMLFPLLTKGVDLIDALFEGVSSITTTGLSCLPPSAMDPTVDFLRSYYQWIGGLGIAFFTLTVLVPPGSAAYNIYLAHLGKIRISPLSRKNVIEILKIYSVLTFSAFITYLVLGMNIYSAVINALTTVSTGGFSTYAIFPSNLLPIVTLFMFISAQPLVTYYMLLKYRRGRIFSPQLVSFTIGVLIGSILLSMASGIPLMKSIFETVSAASTTGYTALNLADSNDLTRFVLVILMLSGACLGSTGGGIKQLRIIILVKSFVRHIKRTLAPRGTILPIKVSGEIIQDDDIKLAYNLLFVYLLVLVVSTLIFMMYGYSLSSSLFETASALATTGLSVGVSSWQLAVPLKIVLIIDMWLGRVEIIPFIIVFYNLFYK